jgi:NADH-quinone oxidoreductase subunit J
MLESIYFYTFAFLALLSGGSLLVVRHPIHGALSLIGTLVSFAGIYSLLHAPFLGVVQILTYAGAIMMLLVFVIMVLNSAHDTKIPRMDKKGIALLVLPLGLAGLLVMQLQTRVITPHPDSLRGTAQAISKVLFDTKDTGPGTWLLFIIVGLLLLSAMISAVLLAKKNLSTPQKEKK